MILEKSFPLSLGHEFRRDIFHNFKTIEQQHNDLAQLY